MLENFLGRSHWFNELMRKQVTGRRLNLLPQTGKASVDQLCDLVLHAASGPRTAPAE